MQIDFHESRSAVVKKRSPTARSGVTTLWQRVGGLIIAIFGMILIIYAGTSLILPKKKTPYGVFFFEAIKSDAVTKPEVKLLWIEESSGTMVITAIPGNLEYHSQSVGTYPLANTFLASQRTKQTTQDFLTDLSFFFRIPVRSVVTTQSSWANTKSSLSYALLKACVRRETSLDWRECLHSWLFVSMYGSRVLELSFPKAITRPGTFAPLEVIDRSAYRIWSQSHFMQNFATWKKYTISVQNGTQISGLATMATGILQDFGLTILSIGETQQQTPIGSIAVSTAVGADSAFVDFLASTLRMSVRIDESLTTQYRSDVVVSIGESEQKFFAP